MPIDPNIILAAGRQPQFDPMASVGKAMQLKSMMDQDAYRKTRQADETQAAAQERQVRGLQITNAQNQQADHQRAIDGQAAVDRLMADSMKADPQTGVYTFDRSQVEQGLVKQGLGHMYPALAETFDKLETSAATAMKARNTAGAHSIMGVQQAGNTPGAALGAIAFLQKNRLMTADDAKPIIDAINADPSPENIGKLLTDYGSRIPEYGELASAAASKKLTDRKTTAEARKLEAEATSIETTGSATPSKLGSLEDFVSTYARDTLKKPVAALTAADKLKAKAAFEAAGRAPSETDAALSLTPDGLDLVANQFAMTGLLPPMGNGKEGARVRTKIINRSAEMYSGLDLASQRAAYEANKKSLEPLQRQRDAISAFEETALKNLDVFIDTAKKVVDTGSPLLNRPLRTFQDSVLGSPEMSAYNVARRTVVPEFAKILNNPNLSGQLSDSARHEVEEVLKPTATLSQIYAAANILKTDVTNRASSMDDQIAAVKKRIATPPGKTASSDTIQKPIPGIDGAMAESTDGGKTWKRIK